MESQRVVHDQATNIFTFTLGKSILLTFIMSVYHVGKKQKNQVVKTSKYQKYQNKGKPGDFLGGSAINNLPVKQELQETQVQFLSPEDPWEEGMATHSGILAWKIPCTEEPGVLQSIGSQRV